MMYHLAARHLQDRPLRQLTEEELEALGTLYTVAVALDSPLVHTTAGDLAELARREAAERTFEQDTEQHAGWHDDLIDAALKVLAGEPDGRYAAVALTADGIDVAKNPYESPSSAQAQATRLADGNGNGYIVTISHGSVYLMHRADGVQMHIRSRPIHD